MTEANGSAPAGNPVGSEAPAGSASSTPAPASGAWYGEISDPNLKGWVENKGFKDPATTLQSYYHLEKLMGHDKAGRTVVLPGENASPEDLKAFYSKLGKPDSPDKYAFPTEGADPDLVSWAKGAFHKANLTDAQAKEMIAEWQGMVGSKQGAVQAESAAKFQAQEASLRKEWGAAFDAKMGQAKAAAREFGLPANAIDALQATLGYDGVMKFMASLGARVGEHGFVGTEGGAGAGSFNGALTPAGAKAKINALRQDQGFVARYTAGDAAAKAEMERLHQWAYPAGGV